MTVTHHPAEALLLDYASGALPEPMALLVATHAALCPACRADIARFERAAGALIDAAAPDADDMLPAELKEAIMARLDEPEPELPANAPANPETAFLPEPLRGYAGKAVARGDWKRWGRGVRQIRLLEGRGDATVRLARIRGGARMPEHTHSGDEATLVLAGGYSDVSGHYLRGDVSEQGVEDVHQPVADAGGDCICLIVSTAPLRLKGLAGAVINPFIRD
ncbi:MAG: ChrR family anti-sigma-E factor [Alphaproteobacteria bacterium]|jgi:putative transcriptional regulator